MLLIMVWSVLGAGVAHSQHWLHLSPPTPILYGSVSSELKPADLKLRSTIGSEVFISVPLRSSDKARPTSPVSYIQLANVPKTPQEQFYIPI